MQNTSTGMIGKTLPVGSVSPTHEAKCPSWKTSTSAPNAAPTESRFRITAFTATSNERKPANSATNVQPTTIRTTSRKCSRTVSS